MKKVCVIANKNKDSDCSKTQTVVNVLSAYGCEVNISDDKNINAKHADLLIILGGDGTIIRASHYASDKGIPILGINLGRRGYLAELEMSELDLLCELFAGNYRIENRMMLDIEYIGNDMHEKMLALNEAVIARGSVSRLSDIQIECDGKQSGTYRGDGIIFSTPTGSTAYSLSAGGPIIDPAIECISFIPVCCHSFDAKPMIFGANSLLTVSTADPKADLYLTVDGTNNIKLNSTDKIRISKSSTYTKLLRIKNESFSEILFRKMSDN